MSTTQFHCAAAHRSRPLVCGESDRPNGAVSSFGPPVFHTAPRFTARHIRWQVDTQWRAILFGPDGPNWAELKADPRAVVVKCAPHRTIYRLDLNDRQIYVKHFHSQHWSEVASTLVRGGPARREWQRLLEIAQQGIPTSRPLACGERICCGVVTESFLVTEAIEGACTLDQCFAISLPLLSPMRRIPARRQLLCGLARFLARMHEAGILHNDLHTGNILVSATAHDKDHSRPHDYYLIDVSRVRTAKPLSWPSARANLATLAAIGRDSTTRTERLRFWNHYFAERQRLRSCPETANGSGMLRNTNARGPVPVPMQRILPDLPTAIAEVHAGTRQFLWRLHRHRDKRTLRTNRDYRSTGRENATVHCLQRLPEELVSKLSRDPESPLWNCLEQPVKLSHSSLIVKATLSTADGPRTVAYKCYRPRNGWKSFCRLFGRDRALWSWRMGQALFERGIATARPMLMIAPRRLRFGRRTYLATEWLEGAENLHLYGWQLAAADPLHRHRRALQCAQSMGRLLGRMHAWGISHGDLKATNLLVVDQGDQVQTFVIDVDDVRLTRQSPPRAAAAELARFATGLAAHPWVTRTMCGRFLREYARQFPRGTIDFKRLWRDISSSADRIAARKRRRGDAVL